MAKKLIFVRLLGGSVNRIFKAKSHELIGLPASTYHKFVMEDDTSVYFHDIGIATVTIADTREALD